MESRKIELTIEQAREFYKEGGKLKELALSVYKEEELMLSSSITEKIKTFTDAVKELGDDNYLVKEYKDAKKFMPCASKDLFAYLKLRIVCAALNEGWMPQFTKDELMYVPYFNLDKNRKKVIFNGTVYYGEYAGIVLFANARFGYILCFKNEKLAEYCGRQFIYFWEDYLLIRK